MKTCFSNFMEMLSFQTNKMKDKSIVGDGINSDEEEKAGEVVGVNYKSNYTGVSDESSFVCFFFITYPSVIVL